MIGLVAYDPVAELHAQFVNVEHAITANVRGLGYGG
jgi:hypothetical protein